MHTFCVTRRDIPPPRHNATKASNIQRKQKNEKRKKQGTKSPALISQSTPGRNRGIRTLVFLGAAARPRWSSFFLPLLWGRFGDFGCLLCGVLIYSLRRDPQRDTPGPGRRHGREDRDAHRGTAVGNRRRWEPQSAASTRLSGPRAPG